MTKRLGFLAALALALPSAAQAGESGTARLLVSAMVVRSVQVSVGAQGRGSAALRVATSTGEAWSASIDAAARASGLGLEPSAFDPSYVVVTVLADGRPPLEPQAGRAPSQHR